MLRRSFQRQTSLGRSDADLDRSVKESRNMRSLRIDGRYKTGLVAMLMVTGLSLAAFSAGPVPPGGEPPAPILIVLNVSGPSDVTEGNSIQLACSAMYSDGTTADADSVWSVVSGSGTIDSSGVYTAGFVGATEDAVIEARVGTKSSEFTVTVIDVPIFMTGITISGASEIQEENTSEYTCTVSYSDGSIADVSPVWSENSDCTLISEAGVLTALDISEDVDVMISATFGNLTNSFPVTVKFVVPPVIMTGITIVGASEVDEEKTAQYTCVASYSDGSSADVVAHWGENSDFAEINGSGVLMADDVSSDVDVVVSAAFGGLTASYSMTIKFVAPPVVLSELSISGYSVMDENSAAGYTCLARYSDGSSELVNPIWSDNSDFAEINESGMLTAYDVTADVDVMVSAEFDGLFASLSVRVQFVAPPVELVGISISGPELILERECATFVCVASYSDGTTEEVTPLWGADLLSVAIDSAGIMSCGNVDADCLVNVSATFGNMSAEFTATVGVISDQVIYPLTGFDGKWIKAEIYDYKTEKMHDLGQLLSPDELVIDYVNPGQWYWVSISEFDEGNRSWSAAFESWVRM